MPPDAQAALREPTVVPVAMQERVVALDAERRDQHIDAGAHGVYVNG